MPRGKRNNYNYYYPQRSLAVGKRNGNPADPKFKQYFTIVNPTDVAGMRKVKNISIQLAYDSAWLNPETGEKIFVEDQRILWAIVYVPRGSNC